MVRFLSPPDGVHRRRRGALPPEALLAALLVASPAAAGGTDAPTAPQGTFGGSTVVARPGDTLSGLAARHLGSAAAWPQVWAQNRHLADPNALEVGAAVRLPGGVGGLHLMDDVDVASAAPAPAPPPVPRPTLAHALWPQAKFDRLGRVVAALGDSTLARRGERLSVHAAPGARLQVGARYVTLAETGAVAGFDGAKGGYVLSVTGVVQAVGDGEETEVVVEHLYAEVEAGQRLAPIGDFVAPAVAATPAAAPRGLSTRLLGLQRNALAAGGGKLAFVGAGSRAGLAPGMRLWFVDDNEAARRPHGRAAGDPAPMPPLGELRVLAVQEESATCAIVRSGREVGRGQTVRGATGPSDVVPSP